MKKIILILISLFFLSCTTDKKNVTGVLYFKMINATSASGLTKKQVSQIEKMHDSLKLIKNKAPNVQETCNYYEKLRKHKLLSSPFIHLELNDKSKMQVFLSIKEFEKVKHYTHNDLNSRGKKVIIELEVKKLEHEIYFSDKIIKFKEADGETHIGK